MIELAAGFLEPPAEARPLVFWQWINGNVSQEGIRLDLEWMQRIGIGGALMFDIGFSRPPVPQYVEKRVGFGTPEWQQAVRFAASEARRLGLLLGAQSSGGWSVSGGPSVQPEQAMKKLVWSETVISPATPQPLRLPPPPSNNGPYQDLPIDNAQYGQPTRSGEIAVIALRLPEAEQAAFARPELSGAPEVALLDDGSHLRDHRAGPRRAGQCDHQGAHGLRAALGHDRSSPAAAACPRASSKPAPMAANIRRFSNYPAMQRSPRR